MEGIECDVPMLTMVRLARTGRTLRSTMIKRNHGESHIGNHKGNFIVTRVAEGRWACNEHLEKGIAVSNINDIMVDLETLGTLPGSVLHQHWRGRV
jgi:hypothetical protein